jgi:hypothetical protein
MLISIKKTILLLLISSSLFAGSFFTLDNVKSLRIYMSAKTDIINPEQKDALKDKVMKKLQSAGFTFGKVDATTFMIKIETLEVDDSNAIYVQIALGEEVTTSRLGNIKSFAFTYMANDFIESEEPYQDITESLEFLISEFLESYKDDNE